MTPEKILDFLNKGGVLAFAILTDFGATVIGGIVGSFTIYGIKRLAIKREKLYL